MISYETADDSVDDKIGKWVTTEMMCLERFCDVTIAYFESEYLRNPTNEDIHLILYHSESRVFFGILGIIDCSKCK